MTDKSPTPPVDAAFLDSVLIGGPEPLQVVVIPYDPAWRVRFEQERERVLGALGERARRVEHIGSTSVPGLAAKPIVDLVVTVDRVEDETLVTDLEVAGYVLRVREPGHRMFRTPERDVHLHMYDDDSPEVEAYLVFRDWLRRSAEDRALYEETKRKLAERSWTDMNYYAEAKSEVIGTILGHARQDRAYGDRRP